MVFLLMLAGAVSNAFGVEIDAWSRRERHLAVVNAVTSERDGFTLSLRGEWDFKPLNRVGTRFPAHTNEFFWTEGVRKIKVPGCWEAQGVGERGQSTPWAVFWDSSPTPYRHVFRGWAWYRKFFSIPAEWKGRRVWLKIGGLASEGTFTVNGKSVARLNPYCGSWKYEITDLVDFGGSNVVAVLVSNRTPSRRGGSLMSNHWGGLWRDVEIESTPMTLIDDAWVQGHFDGRDAQVRVTVEGVEKRNDLILRATVEGEVAERPISSDCSAYDLRLSLRTFRPWSPEHPNLYTARIDLVGADGAVLQSRRERFGVRKLEVRGNEFLLNGRPFFMRGAGYHHIYPLTGVPPADDPDELRRRVRKIRETGFNLVRLHTRCEIPEFFEICDEEGLMVEPELPYYHSLHCDGLAFDPSADARELYEHYRRYPSFAAYSGGNEGDFDEACARNLYREIRTRDPDRLMIAQDGSKDFCDRAFTDFRSGPFTAWPRGSFRSDLPFVAHEYMNQCVKLDTRIAEKFTGVCLPPMSRQERADWLAKFGLGQMHGDRLQEAQNAIQKYWHKYGIEAARADPHCSGYSFWSLQDACSPQCGAYSGQAIYDPFFDDKRGGSTAEEFRRFNGPVALLLDTETGTRDFGGIDPRRVGKKDRMLDCDMDDFDLYVEGTNRIYVSGAPISVKFLLANYGERTLNDAKLTWRLSADGRTLEADEKDIGVQRIGRVRKVFDGTIVVPAVEKGVCAEISVSLSDGGVTVARNAWPVYLLPRCGVRVSSDVAVAPELAGRFRGRFAFSSDLRSAKTIIAPFGSPEAAFALAEGKNLVTLANQDGAANIRLGWWWMGTQMGMVFEPNEVFSELPREKSLSPFYMRIVKEGTPLPLEGFRTDDLIVYGEGCEMCYAYLAIRVLPRGNRHAFVSGLDLLSDFPEGAALLAGILRTVTSGGRRAATTGRACERALKRELILGQTQTSGGK